MASKILGYWKTFHAAAGIKGELVTLLVAVIVGRIDWLYGELIQFKLLQGEAEGMVFGFPSWTLTFVVGPILLFWWVLRYAHTLRTQIEEARVEISKLRKRGVELRNEGRSKITNAEEFSQWHQKTMDWHGDVYKALQKISVADAEWFYTLDVVPPSRLDIKVIYQDQAKHTKRYREHDFQVMRLGEMIRDLWGKNG